MATLKDVTQIAGVTQSTVSRILSQDLTLYVTGETRERAMRITGSLGYKRNTLQTTSSAPTEQEKRIGAVQMFDMGKPWEDIYYLALKNILDEECSPRQWVTVLLYRDERRRFVRRDQAPLDGLSAIGRFTQKEVAGFHKYTDNVVFLDSDPEPMRYYSILPNYYLAAQLALKHPRINGHQLIIYLDGASTFGGHKELMMDPCLYYHRANQTNRDGHDPSLMLGCETNAKSDYAVMRNSLEIYGRPPEAMSIASNSIAPGAMMALRERGPWVPEDISIVAFNSIVLSEYSDPPLTSIELFIRRDARAAAFYMQLSWRGSVRGRRIVVPRKLVSRGNVAPAPTGSPLSELQSE